MNRKRVELFFDFLAFLAAIVYFAILFLNIDYFKVPHGDIYQYIGDAKTYKIFLLPSLIQLQPLTPILMAIIEPFFSNFAFPYFAAAKFINIFAASGTLLFTYFIAKRHLGSKVALMIALLCSIHPLAIINALDITTVGLYVFFTMGSLYFINSNKKMFFIMMTLAFLVRIEGAIILLVYLINQFEFKKIKEKINEKNYQKLVSNIFKENIYPIFFIIFSVGLVIFQAIHNTYNKSAPYGNQYLNEAFSIPLHTENFVYMFGLIGVSFFPESFIWWGAKLFESDFTSNLLTAMSLLILFLSPFFKKARTYGLYVLFMSVIHSFFPGIENRYFFLFLNLLVINIFIIFYELHLKIKSRIIKLISKLILIFIAINWISFCINQINNSFINYREEGLDLYYDVSNWIFNSAEDGNYYIFTEKEYLYSNMFLTSKTYLDGLKTESPILTTIDEKMTKIVMGKKTINFIKLHRIVKQCSSLDCLFETTGQEENAKYLLITNQWSRNQEKDFWRKNDEQLFIDELLKKDHCLKQETSFKFSENAYRQIDSFDRNCYLE